jgi:adenylate cyclase
VASAQLFKRSRPGSNPPDFTTSSSGLNTEFRAAITIAVIVLAGLIFAWALSLAASSMGRDWNNSIDDLLFRLRYALRGPEKMQRSIVHVDLTDSIVEELGLSVGDRKDFARLVRVLSKAGVSSIVLDEMFPAAGTRDGDAAFVRSITEAGCVYLPAVMRTVRIGRAAEVSKRSTGLPDLLERRLWHPKVLRRGSPMSAVTASLSYAALTAAARGVGTINSDPDSDGVIRRMPLLIQRGDGYLPGLSLCAACDVMGVEPARIEVTFGRRIRLSQAHLPDGTVRDVDIPIDEAGRAIIDYAGPWGASFPHYSFAKLLEAETDPAVADSLSAELDGTCVIVSDLTINSSDYAASPLESVSPRSGIHANLLNGMLSNRFLRSPSWFEGLAITLVFAVLLWAAAWRFRPVTGSLLALLVWIALVAGQFGLFVFRGIMPSLAGPTLGFVLALVAVNAWRFVQAERDRLRTRARLERYFAPKLMSKILQAQDRLMSAEQKIVTILFSDISGFTSWCTTQQPHAIHRTLNEYFERMTEIVFRNEGTIDKFIGDGLMAFFGDPFPQSDHALRAVHTGIQMQQEVRRLRARWEAEGRMPLHIRVGINTGEVVIGDMGSRRIMAYTAVGANVNLASRLEGKSPVDGVLVSSAVYRAVKDSVESRFAGRTTAKGIAEDFETYEILVPSD